MERRGSKSFLVLGEGLLGEAVGERQRTISPTAEAVTPPFGFSRMGPSEIDQQIGPGTREKPRRGHMPRRSR